VISGRSVTAMFLPTALLMIIASSAQATPTRPLPLRERFKGSLAVMPALAPEDRCNEPALLLSYDGEGTMSHLGQVTWSSNHCNYLTPEGYPSGRYGEADLVIVAASGDEIHATYDGHQIDDTRYLDLMRITGGTGPFAEARGAALEIVTLDLATFDLWLRGWGWISY